MTVVTTGGGLDFDQVEPLVAAALIDLENPLPANPAGIAQLAAAVDAVLKPPAPKAVAELPPLARQISGQVYAFEPNPAEVDALGLVFDDSAEATLLVTPAGSDRLLSWPIGLDGVCRFSPGDFGLPQGMRGKWTDHETFVLEYDGVASNSHAIYTIRFGDDRTMVQGSEFAHELSSRFEGVLQKP